MSTKYANPIPFSRVDRQGRMLIQHLPYNYKKYLFSDSYNYSRKCGNNRRKSEIITTGKQEQTRRLLLVVEFDTVSKILTGLSELGIGGKLL